MDMVAYFNVSLPRFPMMASPLRIASSTVIWWIGVELYDSGADEDPPLLFLEKPTKRKNRKPAAAQSRTRNRRFESAVFEGMPGMVR